METEDISERGKAFIVLVVRGGGERREEAHMYVSRQILNNGPLDRNIESSFVVFRKYPQFGDIRVSEEKRRR